ncbi:PREDICTED: uncharacterized protein At4g06744-like [Nicotiana attenuata]|uniref:Uncharacterized protein n=1 Tax=Nicotiana attenuata TaxID=49451 RepID=A0A1J6KZD6_NICAT|nr:PREDICTED: uncharacterized protein At4g06744-like [Nicotiana attenuata]OIT28035.1 uncharacterized protein A4A49_20808 [Nicotiana attenuata]
MTTIISITLSFVLVITFFIQIFLQNGLVLAGSILGQSRETLEIIIGGGGENFPPPPPPPDNQYCPPPPPSPEPPCPPPPSPPPYLFESKRIEIAYNVIQKLKAKIKYDPLGIKNTWVGYDVCNKYKGFHCAIVPDYKVQALAAVDFNQFNFAGPDLTLNGFLDELPDITIFHANSNKFTGTIPKKIANLRYLYELDLSNNNYNGEFPYDVLGAKNLTFLDLRFNTFSGLVPPQVFLLNLDVLFINNNNLMQKLPDNLGSTPVLYLTLANNKFTGSIPHSIGQACKTLLEVLFLNNHLTGCLPHEIGLLTKARIFDASKNKLTGKIPHSFGCLANMQILNLAQNQFYGPVPELVCKLPNLKNLSLSYNYFTEVGPECKKLIQRKVLDVRMNCIPELPMQRSVAECAVFFCKPRSCPDEKSLGIVPCKIGNFEQNQLDSSTSSVSATNDPAPAPRTYSALKPHSL